MSTQRPGDTIPHQKATEAIIDKRLAAGSGSGAIFVSGNRMQVAPTILRPFVTPTVMVDGDFNGTDDGVSLEPIDIGFDFTLAGNVRRLWWPNTDGGMASVPDGDSAPIAAPYGTTLAALAAGASNGTDAILAFGADLCLPSVVSPSNADSFGGIRYETQGAAPSRVFVIEFDLPSLNSDVHGRCLRHRAQIHLHEDGSIGLYYDTFERDVQVLSRYTIGAWWRSDPESAASSVLIPLNGVTYDNSAPDDTVTPTGVTTPNIAAGPPVFTDDTPRPTGTFPTVPDGILGLEEVGDAVIPAPRGGVYVYARHGIPYVRNDLDEESLLAFIEAEVAVLLVIHSNGMQANDVPAVSVRPVLGSPADSFTLTWFDRLPAGGHIGPGYRRFDESNRFIRLFGAEFHVARLDGTAQIGALQSSPMALPNNSGSSDAYNIPAIDWGSPVNVAGSDLTINAGNHQVISALGGLVIAQFRGEANLI